MTKQEIFDKVAVHLVAQNERSWDYNTCLYRGPNGLKCAVGCLIPDNEYTPEMETKSAQFVLPMLSDKTLSNSFELEEMLSNLQRLHDGWTPEHWPQKLRDIAKEYGLTCPV